MTVPSVETPRMDDPDAYRTPVPMALVDVAKTARSMYGENRAQELFPDLPGEDWRFVALLPGGGHITFGSSVTAAQITAILRREGVDMDSVEEPR